MTEARTRPIKATIVSDITKARTIPGAYKYFSDGTTIGPTGMTIICPCGCGAIQPLHFKPGPSPPLGSGTRPTLQPSVHHKGHWHGRLRRGIWESR